MMTTPTLNSGIQKRIAYGLWLHDQAPNNVSHPVPLRDLTLSWLRFGYQGEVIESPKLEEILQRALSEGYDACVIFSPGIIINEVWKLPHWQSADFYHHIHDYFAYSDTLLSANTYQSDNGLELDTACLLIDLARYAEHRLIDTENAAKTDWLSHYDVTEVTPLPSALTSKFVNLARPTESQADAFFQSLDTQLQRGRQGVFLWNIEAYEDIAPVPENQAPVSQLLCVAAGFKPLKLLAQRGFDSHTKVTFFDYSQRALEIRQRLIRDWDGHDYPSFCRQIVADFPATETFYQLWDGLGIEQIDWHDVDTLWQAELRQWGGAERLAELWNAHRQLEFEFIHCDVVQDPTPVIQRIEAQTGTTLWWSNAFFTIGSNWRLSIQQRRARFLHWINAIADQVPHATLFGADHNNAPINNIAAADYRQYLMQTDKPQLADELRPYAESVYNLRF